MEKPVYIEMLEVAAKLCHAIADIGQAQTRKDELKAMTKAWELARGLEYALLHAVEDGEK